jgi:hypothetical protein
VPYDYNAARVCVRAIGSTNLDFRSGALVAAENISIPTILIGSIDCSFNFGGASRRKRSRVIGSEGAIGEPNPGQQRESFPLQSPQRQQASSLRESPSVDRLSAANSDHRQGPRM